MKNLTLVIPAKKESESLAKVLNELKPSLLSELKPYRRRVNMPPYEHIE